MFLAERVSSCILYIYINVCVVAKRSGFPRCLCASPQERKVKEGEENEKLMKLETSRSRRKTKLFLMH